jgi:hypothetical protein
LCGIDFLDILSLDNGTLVATQTLLGKFVNALVSSGTTSLDHVKDATFIWGKSDNLTSDSTDELGAVRSNLRVEGERDGVSKMPWW